MTTQFPFEKSRFRRAEAARLAEQQHTELALWRRAEQEEAGIERSDGKREAGVPVPVCLQSLQRKGRGTPKQRTPRYGGVSKKIIDDAGALKMLTVMMVDCNRCECE